MSAGSFAKLPMRFGRYQVEKLLGKGAMGAVYLARDTQLDRLVALKIPILSAKGSEKLLKRLKTEAMAAAQIDHPSVCPVFDSGDIDGIPYIAMQYIEGETLKDHLKNQAKSPQEAVRLIVQLAEGLAEAHSRKIYHRDLKPENIKLNRRGVPVIMDFGLAKLAATLTADAGATQKGSILGSPAYMSPEQASGKVEEIDHRSDLYALGVMLYEMLTGTWPFTGAAIQVMGQKSVLEPPSPLTVKPELNPQLAAVCQKLIAKKREDRYQTAQEVIAALVVIDFGSPPPAAGTQPPFGSSTDAEITDFLKEIAVGSPKPVAPKKAPAPLFGKDKSGKDKKKRLLIGGGILGVLVLLAGLVISFRTREGTLVVTVNEPDADVEVLNEAGTVEIKRKGDKGPITISVDPGKHRLKVQKDGFEFFSKEFEIASGGKTSITAKLVPREDKSEVAAQGWQDWPADAPPPAIAPFDAATAKKYQAAWAKFLKLEVEYTNTIGMKFILIPPGEFTMGSTPAEIEEALKFVGEDKHWQECIKSEGPQHKVILTQPIYLGIHEVTQADYKRVMGKNPSHFAPTGAGKDAVAGRDTTTHPVEMVNWNDAAEFCAKLSQQEQLKPFHFRAGETVTPLEGTGYRLPTEAEWEFACRAGTTTKYWNGDKDEDLAQSGWFRTNSGNRSHAPGELKANPFRLHDIDGNIGEWVQDRWEPNYFGQFRDKPALDPSGPSSAGSRRVVRSCSWYDPATVGRASSRHAHEPWTRYGSIGFRVSLLAGAVKAAIAESKIKPASVAAGWHGWPADAPPPAIAPFDAERAKKHQADWAAYLKVPVEYTNSLGMKFRLIPPGEFMMGCTPAEMEAARKFVHTNDWQWHESIKSEAPQRKVILTQPIYVGVNEVTQAEYEKVTGQNPSRFAPTGAGKEAVDGLDTARHPVETVSWNDAAEFCAKLSRQEKFKPFYARAAETITPLDGTGYRLPSEAEWEFACRAGTATKYWIGDKDEDLQRAGWIDKNSGGRTHAAGELAANPFGLYDIHGNVWEWVQDGWDPTYYAQFQEKPAINPNSPFSAGSRRGLRGGGWYYAASNCRSSDRPARDPTLSDRRIGFRASFVVGAVKKGEATKPVTTLNDPAFQNWMKVVAGMPAEKQVEAVARKLQELNSAFDGKVTPKIGNGVVTELAFVTDNVTDLSPIRALTGLKTLKCNDSPGRKGKLSDLSPLKGLSLTTLNCDDTQVSDLSPLEGMPLDWLECIRTNVATLSALKGMPLSHLDFGFTKVSDLSPLQKNTTLKSLWFDGAPVSDLKPLAGLSLVSIICMNSLVSDLSPLKGMPLDELLCIGSKVTDLSPIKDIHLLSLSCNFKLERDSELVRSIGSLKFINGKPATEFWKEFEASVTFLADLSPVWKTQVHPYFSTDGTIEGRKYVVQGKESPNGIFLHPPVEGFSEIVYTLNRAFEKFESGVAIPGMGKGAGSPLTFEVIGDDTVLWASKPVQEFDRPQSCAVNVKNVNTLSLRVHCPGSHSDARAVWLEPRLFASPSAPATGLQPPKWDVERSAAEWILSLGGTVGIRVERQERELAAGGTLPAGNFVLERIDLRGKPITAADLARLEGLSSLHKLVLVDSYIGDAGLAHLRNLTGLSELIVWSAGISDAGLVHLKDLNHLKVLSLGGANPDVTDAGLPHLAQLTKLENLDLNGTHITNNGLEHVRKFSGLKGLTLMNTAVNDDGIHFLEGLTNLRVLFLAGSKIGDACLAHLKGLTNLEVLTLDDTSIGDDGLAHLETLSKLTFLGLGGTKVSDEGLRHVARVTGLQGLHLDKSNVSDAGIDSLLALRKLHYLHVNETRISAAGFARLKEAFPKADLAWSLKEDK